MVKSYKSYKIRSIPGPKPGHLLLLIGPATVLPLR